MFSCEGTICGTCSIHRCVIEWQCVPWVDIMRYETPGWPNSHLIPNPDTGPTFYALHYRKIFTYEIRVDYIFPIFLREQLWIIAGPTYISSVISEHMWNPKNTRSKSPEKKLNWTSLISLLSKVEEVYQCQRLTLMWYDWFIITPHFEVAHDKKDKQVPLRGQRLFSPLKNLQSWSGHFTPLRLTMTPEQEAQGTKRKRGERRRASLA